MSRVEIVDYEPGLAPAFRTLNLEWLERSFEVEPVDEAILNDPQRAVIDGGGAILFARAGRDVIGTVALKHHGDGVFELTKMAVTERCRGRGIGRRLLDACLEKYRALGGRELYLESHSSLAAALELYASAGFERRSRESRSEYARADVYMVYRDPQKDARSGT